MTKRLCKYNRVEIADNLGAIHGLVLQPKFLCRSCARSSSDKQSLCKPAAVPSASAEKLFSMDAVTPAIHIANLEDNYSDGVSLTHFSNETVDESRVTKTMVNKTTVTKAKKSLKKQKKYHKQLKKLAKKQKQLVKKQKKINKQFALLDAKSDKYSAIETKQPSEQPSKQLH